MPLILIYWVAGYWAAGVVCFENRIIIHQFGALFMQKCILGLLLGWILIPIALIKRLCHH